MQKSDNLKQEKRLNELYKICIDELKSIEINMQDEKIVGKIDIKISTRASKRYGCCKQENPDKKYKVEQKNKYRRIIKYEKYQNHHIEISSWVMDLNEDIIKNTIMHELIHCIPFCNNHGMEFKKYATYISQKLGYKITTKGDKKQDYKDSNLVYEEQHSYKYKIVCKNCGQVIYRQRFNKKQIGRYRCGRCRGALELVEIKNN